MGKSNPNAFGWDDYLGGGGYEHRDPMIFQKGNSRRGQGWAADIWTEYTLKYIREHRAEPWFASVAFIIPHLPWVCDEKYSAPLVAQGCSKDLAACYGSIAHLDECIGRLLDGLRETGQDQRTIVVFLSDNGATGPEAKNSSADGIVTGQDWDQRNAAKLRGHKATVWENGIRVPFLVRWPGQIPAGERRQFGTVEDVLPTLLNLSGIKPEATPHQPFTGVNLRPSMYDPEVTLEHPEAFRVAIAGGGSPREVTEVKQRKFEDHHLTLRGPRFKYHALPQGKNALYDLAADPGETADVQAKFPNVATRMARECRERWDAIIGSGRAFVTAPDNLKGKATIKAEP